MKESTKVSSSPIAKVATWDWAGSSSSSLGAKSARGLDLISPQINFTALSSKAYGDS